MFVIQNYYLILFLVCRFSMKYASYPKAKAVPLHATKARG
jgi:hypothetical protein